MHRGGSPSQGRACSYGGGSEETSRTRGGCEACADAGVFTPRGTPCAACQRVDAEHTTRLAKYVSIITPTTKSILTKHTTGRILIELVKFKTRKILWLEASVTSRTLCSQRCEDNRKLSWLSLFLLPPVGYCQLQIVF